MNRLYESRGLPVACFVAALVASFAYLVGSGTHFSFVYDEWELLVRRPGWSPDTILEPFHEHLIAAPALFYKLLQESFGMTSALPYYVVAIAVFAIAAALLFVFLHRRLGAWLALFAVLPVLFLGASSEDLLWAFQVCFFGSVAAGVGMLVALDRGDRLGDRLACGLLAVSLAFSGVGVPFLVAAGIDVLLGPRPRRRRVFVVALPLALYGLWWIGWGHNAEHSVTLDNVVHLPGYVFDAAGAGFAALFGQEVNDPSNPGHAPLLFRALATVVAIAVGVKIARERRVSRGLAVVLVLTLGYWVLAGLDRNFARPPISNRYQYPSAVFILLVAAEALKGVRVPRVGVLAVAAMSVVGTIGGISLLQRERPSWNTFGDSARAVLAGVELAGPSVKPRFQITGEGIGVSVGEYRNAASRFGSPAFDEREVLDRALSYGPLVDSSMVEAAGIAIMPSSGSPVGPRTSRCRTLDVGGGPGGMPVRAERLALVNHGAAGAVIDVARFGPGPGLRLGVIQAGTRATLRLPLGESPRPWRVDVPSGGPVRLCETPG